MAADAVGLSLLCEHDALAPSATSQEHLVLRLTTPPAAEVQPLPLCAVLVLDVSGSMDGEPLREVKHAVTRLTEVLGDEDALGVVTFSTEARVLSGPRALRDPDARSALRRLVAELRADGSTNIDGGLSKAALLLPPRSGGSDITRLVALLLSDGQPNVGARSPQQLAEAVRLIKDRGVAVSCLGFGASHNEDVLVAIAEAGGGRYAFVKDPRAADSSFARALGVHRDVVAEQVRLLLKPASGVEIAQVLGDPPLRYGAEGVQLRLPDLVVGDAPELVVQLSVTARREIGPARLLRATLRYQRPRHPGERPIEESADAVVDIIAAPRPPSKEVLRAVAMARGLELRRAALRHGDRRNFTGAVAALQQACALINQVPGFARNEATSLGELYEALVDDIENLSKAPDPEQYQILRKVQFDQQSVGGSLSSAPASPSAAQLSRATTGGPRPARLIMLDGGEPGRVYRFDGELRLGRGQSNQVVLVDAGVSRLHALIQPSASQNGFLLEDMGSSNGTVVNGKHIYRGHLLRSGDVIQLGAHRFRFEEGS